MEKSLMWMRRQSAHEMLRSKFEESIRINGESKLSWEERAFEEDHVSGYLNGAAGCIWPPRSYLCSFCKREFKSAQALGGHMNVHRRDRARLKHSLAILEPPQYHQNHHHRNQFGTNHVLNNNKSLESPNSVCTSINTASPSSPNYSRVASNLLAATQEINTPTIFNASPLNSYHHVISNNNMAQQSKLPHEVDHQKSTYHDHCCSLGNISSTQSYNSRKGADSCDYDYDVVRYKKAKTSSSNYLSSNFMIQSSDHRGSCLQLEVGSGTMEEIDLELRLGNPPKVK